MQIFRLSHGLLQIVERLWYVPVILLAGGFGGLCGAEEERHYRQTEVYGCGIACLMCAALELGVKYLPSSYTVSKTRLKLNRRTECLLYRQAISKTEQRYETRLVMPVNLVLVARDLGLFGYIYLDKTFRNLPLRRKYQDQILLAEKHNIPVLDRHDQQRLRYQELWELKIMFAFRKEPLVLIPRIFYAGFSELHYLMQRNDGSIMEPGTGVNYIDIEQLNGFGKNPLLLSIEETFHYREIGISVFLSRIDPDEELEDF
ncbi:hypothetical protein ACWJJH_16170 [Endozoicomonadaceae bacterium StTr2]